MLARVSFGHANDDQLEPRLLSECRYRLLTGQVWNHACLAALHRRCTAGSESENQRASAAKSTSSESLTSAFNTFAICASAALFSSTVFDATQSDGTSTRKSRI